MHDIDFFSFTVYKKICNVINCIDLAFASIVNDIAEDLSKGTYRLLE